MDIIEKYADLKVDNARLNRSFEELALCISHPERMESMVASGQTDCHRVFEFLYYLYKHQPHVFQAWDNYQTAERNRYRQPCKPLWRRLLRL